MPRYPPYRMAQSKLRHSGQQPLDVLRTRQPMIAILDQGEHDVVLRQTGGEVDGVLPGHVRVLDPLKDADRATGFDHAVEQQVPAPFLDQLTGYRIRLFPIPGWSLPGTPVLDLLFDLRRKL